MNRILIATAAVLALSGTAFAQMPQLSGNYSANVIEQSRGATTGQTVDLSSTASVSKQVVDTQPALSSIELKQKYGAGR